MISATKVAMMLMFSSNHNFKKCLQAKITRKFIKIQVQIKTLDSQM